MTPNQFLKHARLWSGDNRFAVGTFERGITFYSQQVRALNLVHSMRAARDAGRTLFGPRTKVLIIGGGAFGITAAAAASSIGFDVWLLETCQVLTPAQRGCDTRWLHPHFYNWPKTGAEDAQARLPILDWRAGTAGQVAEQVEASFNRYCEEAKQKGRQLSVTLGAKDVQVKKLGRSGKSFIATWRDAQNKEQRETFRAVIYGVGFGIEHNDDLSRNHVNSYWRNDELSQIDMSSSVPRKYLVSGMGDGGVTDLFRLRISNFRHERIFYELFSNLPGDLINELRKIAAHIERYPGLHSKEGWLFDQFGELETAARTQSHFGKIKRTLKARLRRDTHVQLNGRSDDIRLCLKTERTAFKNALLTFILHRIDAFEYVQADLSKIGTEIVLDRSGKMEHVPPTTTIIVRHGTNRRESLKENLALSRRDIALLERRASTSTDSAIYNADWWAQQRYKAKNQTIAPEELLPVATAALGNMFLTTLADILDDAVQSTGNGNEAHFHFRLTLHRLIEFNGQQYFQQLTPYAGRVKDKGARGRLFGIASTIGLACRSGTPVIVKRISPKQWKKVWQLMKFNKLHARAIHQRVKSILACPFFAFGNGTDDERVNLVLFADSSNADFFSQDMLHTIYAACKGFVANLEKMRETDVVFEVFEKFAGPSIERNNQLRHLMSQLETLGVRFEHEEFSGFKRDLTFKTLQSLNLAFGPPSNLGRGADTALR